MHVDNGSDASRLNGYWIEWRRGDIVDVLSSDPRRFRQLHAQLRSSGGTGDLVIVDEFGNDRIRQAISPDLLAD